MIAEQLKSEILKHFGQYKVSRKNWYYRNCPLCHTQGHGRDTRSRFGLKIDTDGGITVNCFNCGFNAIWKPGETITNKFQLFLLELGISEIDIKKLAFAAFNEANHIGFVGEFSLTNDPTSKWKPIDFPKKCKSLEEWAKLGCDDTDYLGVLEYAVSRGFTKIDELYWIPEPFQQVNKRLILPFYYKGDLVGYTGRFANNNISKKTPKYVNTMPDNYVYNLDSQINSDKEYVILTEGVFDAWVVDGISCMNSSISPDQIAIINRLNKKIIVVPDFDKDGIGYVETAKENEWMVSIPNWGRDVKDSAKAAEKYGRLLTVQSIIHSAEEYSIQNSINWEIKVKGHGYRK
jgi:hypothetical protein